MNTWKFHCDYKWEINILNKKSIKIFLEEDIDYPNNIWNCKPDKQSDMFGCALVNKYGGVWIDSNIIMRKPIYFILDKEWFGYCKTNETKPELFLFATCKKLHN